MACEAVRMWSLSGLIAAFLDLVVAYLLLCASAVVYLASKFVGFFGVNLPCPCDGMFMNMHNKALCFDRLLIDLPIQTVSDVQLCVKQRIPFSYGVSGDNCVNGVGEIEGEVSSSSLEVARSEKGLNQRPKARLRRRGVIEDASLPVENGGIRNLEYDDKAPIKKRGRQRSFTNVETNESHDEDVHIKKSIKDVQDNQQSFSVDDKTRIRMLEQKLEEEHIARAALYIELEKERNASATAADEAMAMILRLQEEKASIEIEARQYQRILEEKSVYDAEEMSILKEILVRREMEKHFLEKEVEAYRQTGSVENDEQYSFEEKEIIVTSFNPEQVHETSGMNHDRVSDEDTRVYDLHIIGETDDVKRSNREINRELPPIGRTKSSTSAMESEMVKIDSEIGRLRERLKLVQEGREKLGLSSENRESENVQLRLLEDIAQQVQEIRRMTEHGKGARQASLPPPASKALSKKRRSRSVSSGLRAGSSEG